MLLIVHRAGRVDGGGGGVKSSTCILAGYIKKAVKCLKTQALVYHVFSIELHSSVLEPKYIFRFGHLSAGT